MIASERWRHARPAARRVVDARFRRTASRCRAGADGILAVGGGSAIDTGKAASAQTGLPLVSVPTTYSGAEWTTFYGIRSPDRRIQGGGGGAHPARSSTTST